MFLTRKSCLKLLCFFFPSLPVSALAISLDDFIVLPNGAEAQYCTNDGTGGFSCANLGITYSASAGGVTGASGDFDSDKVIDFVAILDEADAEFCKGDASGMNFDCVSIGIAFDGSTGGIAATSGDFDNDGNLDLFVAPDFVSPVQFCAGDGGGGFSCASIGETFNSNVGGIAATAGDFDKDGSLDVVVVGDNLQIQLCLGDGSGGFSCDGIGVTFADGLFGQAAATADFDEDGNLDFIAVFNDLESNLCLGDGEGAFSCSGIGESFSGGDALGADVADFDDDGHADFVVVWDSAIPQLCLGDGDGAFSCSPFGAAFPSTGRGMVVMADDYREVFFYSGYEGSSSE